MSSCDPSIWSPRQGMSDLAAPLLAVLQDEADAFWCFAALMERLQSNFDTDCSCASPSLCPLQTCAAVLSSIHQHLPT